ncbi:pyridoxal-phosphate-dependent aminotransferase family protein [Falsirhodobacter sp. 20TX0035]|uniref:pyridoxal-phosphate-dependent aminotransferase family protein n=1 Tax=Falsirhodobacter sp. 20TX0035 TaxID=3022019 RepID=UPI0023302F5D|nr:aminotransferase class V-fold PLP-dependent enzyme [Falsirhodobacter sp. 20TX0035]MDB6453541.1 aminotransferase class V-fold PLP-dependent enzyme [Falsirhodobacter sp. 20TX0035]
MSLANGRHYLAIPGPSVMPDRVLAAMHRAAPNIYEGALHDMVNGIVPDLKWLAGTSQNVAIYIGNGHAAWEAAIANMFSRGEKALVCVTGHFGLGWAEAARAMGVEVEVIDFGRNTPVDPGRVEGALRAHPDTKAVLVTHVDTATTVLNDVAAVRRAIDAAGSRALLAVDSIASLGCDVFRMDDWGVDVLVAASQKGLMVPPGLGFVWFSDRAAEVARSSDLRTPTWDWTRRANPRMFHERFGGTAPTHHLFALREALDMLKEEGLDAIWHRHDTLARAVWAAFDAWGADNPQIGLNVADPAHRGRSVTAARFGAPHATAIRRWTEEKAGVTLGIGLGMADPSTPEYHGFLRVAHMGHVNAHMTLGVIGVIEAAMLALDIPHGTGAMRAAAAIVAQGA